MPKSEGCPPGLSTAVSSTSFGNMLSARTWKIFQSGDSLRSRAAIAARYSFIWPRSLLPFSLFEKAVIKEKNWKFTRHGICLTFANGARLRLKKNFESEIWKDKAVDNHPILQALFGEDGFKTQSSYFDEAPFDELFNPAEHHFLYPLDSHTTKGMMEALQDDIFAFAIQTLPGTSKAKVAANIVAENVVQGKKTLVLHRRAISKQLFNNAWKPPFKSNQGPAREALQPEFIKQRKSFIEYYKTINENVQPAGAALSDLLTEFVHSPATKTKFSESIFDGVSKLDFATYNNVKALVEKITDLYFKQQGISARKARRWWVSWDALPWTSIWAARSRNGCC